MNEKEFLSEVKEISLINQSLELLNWDSQTGMPEESSDFRGELTGYLSKLSFEKSIGNKIKAALDYFTEHPEELSSLGRQVFEKVKEDYELNCSIDPSQMQAYKTALIRTHTSWLKARKVNDFKVMQDSLKETITFLKTFIPIWKKNEKTNYDVLLNLFEPEMTVEKLDPLFEKVKQGIIAIRKEIEAKGQTPRTDFLTRKVPKKQQQKFVEGIATQLGFDFQRGRLDDTVHPFMQKINRKDARMTTCWDEENFKIATFGVIHEAGHGIYEQNIAPKYDYTPLSVGTSMGIHESQSLFNEIIIGSNKEFWRKQFPFFKECTEGTFDDLDFSTFYASLLETKASLIRIHADSLTYPLHIIIRYEIEKMIFNDGVSVEELPAIWNQKYEEYLGIRPETDLEGILQDIHWSDGSFGYFPSYALGYMYAAQLSEAMSKAIDIDKVLSSEDYRPIRVWLTEHIHQYGASKKPIQLIKAATGEELNPDYLIQYLRKIYFDIYEIA